jgi:hypothetical protein
MEGSATLTIAAPTKSRNPTRQRKTRVSLPLGVFRNDVGAETGDTDDADMAAPLLELAD